MGLGFQLARSLSKPLSTDEKNPFNIIRASLLTGRSMVLGGRSAQGEPVPSKPWMVSCHDIAAVWVAFFSRWQRYRCRQGFQNYVRAFVSLSVCLAQMSKCVLRRAGTTATTTSFRSCGCSWPLRARGSSVSAATACQPSQPQLPEGDNVVAAGQIISLRGSSDRRCASTSWCRTCCRR